MNQAASHLVHRRVLHRVLLNWEVFISRRRVGQGNYQQKKRQTCFRPGHLLGEKEGQGFITLVTSLVHTRKFQTVSLNGRILGEAETTAESRFVVVWDDSTLGLLFLFLLLYRHVWKIYVYPCFHQSPLSNLYLTLYLVQVGIF